MHPARAASLVCPVAATAVAADIEAYGIFVTNSQFLLTNYELS